LALCYVVAVGLFVADDITLEHETISTRMKDKKGTNVCIL
jgi:hypothetical protein